MPRVPKWLLRWAELFRQLMYVLKLFRVTAGSIPSFRICSKETLRKAQRIHLRCGLFGSKIYFWILVKKRNIRFRIRNPDLDFSKEKHP